MPEPLITQENFKNRQTLLVVFGSLEIIMGSMTALMAIITTAVPFLPKMTGHESLSLRLLLPGILLYAGAAVAFVWLGIGSILCRRWARALLLILGWYWLATGLMSMSYMIFIMPTMSAHQPGLEQIPAGIRTALMLVTVAISSVINIIIPTTIILFYKSPHVKATCEDLDSKTRWTDACPLPVLALSLFTIFSALTMVSMIFSFHGIVPFFGMYITGIPGMVILMMFSAVYIYASRACYKLQLRGWWALVIAYGLSVLSCTVTFAAGNRYHMYELMELPASQLATLKETNILQTPLMWIMAILCTLPFFAFLLYTKRYFKTLQSGNNTPSVIS